MNAAAFLLVYSAALTWCAHLLLRRLTGESVNPGLAVAAWLTAVVGALGAWAVALIYLTVAAARTVLYGSPLTFCLSSLGIVADLDLPRHAAPIALVSLLSAALVATVLVVRRVATLARQMRTRGHEHAAAARIVGRQGAWPDVAVITAQQPSAYCVAGRPRTIVVTTGALVCLDQAQLAAVLAHERAHLRGRHHQILIVLRALAVTLPRLPLFAAATPAVAALLEMCADDAAVRRHGSDNLIGGLIGLAGRSSTPAPALAAAATDVLARAQRLVAPAPRVTRWYVKLNLGATVSVTAAAPVLTAVLCHH